VPPRRLTGALAALRRTMLAALALALFAALVASADTPHENRGAAAVAPARGGGLTGGE
jgi:hypothetical protein